MRASLVTHFAAVATLLTACAGHSAEPVLQVPPGFVIERVSPDSIRFPMFATLDDRRRLYVTESSGGDLYAELQKQVRECRISVLEDTDPSKPGFESARIFAEKLTPSMGLAWREGKLYAADPPDLVTLADTDGDGRADQRQVILSGFGHTDNGSLHGLVFGPDGWLYFTMGNPDGYDLRGPDGSRARGGVGALIRCGPDGSGVETVAHGFDNLIEVTFLPDGAVVGTLNWYQMPERGLRDALVQILEGSQFPLHPFDALVPHPQFNRVLPPLAMFPAVAHSGIELYRGEVFPAAMRDNLFVAQHNTRKIVRHRLTPKAASYAVETFDFVTTDDPDVHFSDVLEDTDGSLLLVDTGSWYVQHCPTGRIRQAPARGAIYRARFGDGAGAGRVTSSSPSSEPVDLRSALRGSNAVAAAAAARMAGRRDETNAAGELTALLRSTNLALRLAAAEALTHCGSRASASALVEALGGDTDPFLEHALTFALHRLADQNALRAALQNRSFKIQRAALLLLDHAQAISADAVVERLNASDAALREAARWVLLRHAEWGEAGATFLRQLIALAEPTEADQAALSQFLPRFHTNSAVMEAVASSLASSNRQVTERQRERLLEAVSALDIQRAPEPLARAILDLMSHSSLRLRLQAIRAAGALPLPQADDSLAAIARRSSELAQVRVAALRALGHRRPLLEKGDMDLLLAQLASTNNSAARLAAAETLFSARLNAGQMAAFLKAARGETLISPASILAAVERNALYRECAAELVDYLAASLEAGWAISADELAKVFQSANLKESDGGRAGKLSARLQQNLARQRQQLAEFEPLLKGGDYVRGQKVFHEKAQCTVCHQIWGNGGRVGPDLTSVGSIRAGRDLLESLVLPSSTIAQGYETLVATTKDGQSYTGVKVGKGEEPLVLRVASGAEVILRGHEIEQIERSKLSLMPENLVNTLTREELRDLLGYLQQLK